MNGLGVVVVIEFDSKIHDFKRTEFRLVLVTKKPYSMNDKVLLAHLLILAALPKIVTNTR